MFIYILYITNINLVKKYFVEINGYRFDLDDYNLREWLEKKPLDLVLNNNEVSFFINCF